MLHFCMANAACGQEPTNLDFVSIRALRDVTAQIRKRYNMESLEKKKRGGKYGVAGISSKESSKNDCHTEGISMHLFPKDEEVR